MRGVPGTWSVELITVSSTILSQILKMTAAHLNLVCLNAPSFVSIQHPICTIYFSVGDVMRTNIKNAAKTAVKALKHGSELGECYKGELLKVESASVEVVEGLQSVSYTHLRAHET